MMKIEQSAITGHEDKSYLTPPLRALSEFYDAFNNRNLEKMAKNWSQSDEAVMDNPVGGIMRGWEKIRAVYEKIFGGAARVVVEFHDYSLHETSEVFYAVGRERGELKKGDAVINLAIRTSRIFRLIDGQWRQTHHHGSMDDPDLLLKYQQAVKGKE